MGVSINECECSSNKKSLLNDAIIRIIDNVYRMFREQNSKRDLMLMNDVVFNEIDSLF